MYVGYLFMHNFFTLMKTSRRDLLEWMKSLNIEINKIEELGQGTAMCHLLSMIHPNTSFVYLKNPTTKYDYLKNLKVVQNFFFVNNIELRFPIGKLVECKLQDNLEMAQWLYKYYVKCTKNKSREIEKKNKNPHKEDTSAISNKNEIIIDTDFREKNRHDIIENLKKHYEECNTKLEDKYKEVLEQNKILYDNLKEKDEKNLIYKEKLGFFADNNIQDLINSLEKDRDFYFLILIEIEEYIKNNDILNENIKNDIFNILYKKQ